MTNYLNGICLSPYQNGQSPDSGSQITKDQIQVLLKTVMPYFEWVLSYSCLNGIGEIAPVAKGMGKKVAAGCWLSNVYPQNNDKDLEALAALCNKGYVDLAVIGNEAINDASCKLTGAEVIKWLDKFKGLLTTNTPYTTALIPSSWTNNPTIADHCTGPLNIHVYPYWQGNSIEGAEKGLNDVYFETVDNSAFSGRKWILGETGWPSNGGTVGGAVPSLTNEESYLKIVYKWANEKKVQSFWFEAVNEAWKHQNWGLWPASEIGVAPGPPVITIDPPLSKV